MWLRSCSARVDSSTRYAIAPAQLVEHLAGWPSSAVIDVVQALPDCFVNVGACGDIEQSLILFRILNDSLGLAVDSQHHRLLALLDLLEKFGRIAPKVCQRLDVFRDVELC